jgi:hypothetical protein
MVVTPVIPESNNNNVVFTQEWQVAVAKIEKAKSQGKLTVDEAARLRFVALTVDMQNLLKPLKRLLVQTGETHELHQTQFRKVHCNNHVCCRMPYRLLYCVRRTLLLHLWVPETLPADRDCYTRRNSSDTLV